MSLTEVLCLITWQANTGRVKEFNASLQKLRGENADISEEAAGIRVNSILNSF